MPQYFPWEPDFIITGGGYQNYGTDFDRNDYKPSGTPIYVDNETGNDTTGNGSALSPYRTLQKAYEVGDAAAADSSSTIIISAAGGFYDEDSGFDASWNTAHTIAILSTDLETVYINRAENGLSWTEEVSGTRYSVTVDDPAAVLDLRSTRSGTDPDDYLVNGSDKVPLLLTEVASTAEVEATAGTKYHDGTKLHVHLIGDAVPNENTKVLRNESVTAINLSNASVTQTIYLENVEFWGNAPFDWNAGTDSETRFVGYKAAARYNQETTNPRGFEFNDIKEAYCIYCHATDNDTDGFNYHRNIGSLDYPEIFEFGCVGSRNGISTGSSTHNGSTIHEKMAIIRVNGWYQDNYGGNVGDIQGGRSVLLGSNVSNSLGTGAGLDAGIVSGTFLNSVDPNITWVKDTISTGSINSTNQSTGGIIIDKGGNTFDVAQTQTNKRIDAVTYPELEIILTAAPDSILGVHTVLDAYGFDNQSGEVDDFFDYSANKLTLTKSSVDHRATYGATLANGLPGWSIEGGTDVSGLDTKYIMSKSTALYSMAIIGQYGDGVTSSFVGYSTLLGGLGVSANPRIMGNISTSVLLTANQFSSQFSRDGGTPSNTVLPMPFDFYQAVSSTLAAKTDTYRVFGNAVSTNRAWDTEATGMIIFAGRAWTSEEELAIRTAAKELFEID